MILDETTVRDFTNKYYVSKMKIRLLGNYGLVTPSTVTPFSVMQKSDRNYWRSEAKHTVTDILL